MKKNSIILVLFLTLSASLLMPVVKSQESCSNLLLHLMACTGEIFSFVGQKRPISHSCCNTIFDISNYCPRSFQTRWLVECENSCLAKRANPPPSDGGNIPSTPAPNHRGNIWTPPPPPPPYRDNENCPDISRLYEPCHEQIEAYYNHKTPIGSSCCSLIIEVHDKCSPRHWSDMAIQCHDYCVNHQDNTATPPPAPPLNNGGDIATPPPQSSETPPPYSDKESCPDISRLYTPCHEQIDAYYEHQIPISSSCCALIIEVHDKCSPRHWSDTAIKCHDYCLNHH